MTIKIKNQNEYLNPKDPIKAASQANRLAGSHHGCFNLNRGYYRLGLYGFC